MYVFEQIADLSAVKSEQPYLCSLLCHLLYSIEPKILPHSASQMRWCRDRPTLPASVLHNIVEKTTSNDWVTLLIGHKGPQ